MSDYPEFVWLAVLWGLLIAAHAADLLTPGWVAAVGVPSTVIVALGLVLGDL